MKKQISPKIVSLIFAVLIVCFAVAFYALGQWTEPGTTPPGGNVDAPVNIGDTAQYKSGALGIGGLFQTDNETHLAIVGGNVGIGTTSPSQKLDVEGNIVASGTICDSTGCIGAGGIGDITAVYAGTGLTGGGTSGDVTLNANTTYLQRRVTGTCGSNQAIRVINANGTVSCVNLPSSPPRGSVVGGGQYSRSSAACVDGCWSPWGSAYCSGILRCPAGSTLRDTDFLIVCRHGAICVQN